MKEYHIKLSWFDRKRKLILTESYIEFEGGDLIGKTMVKYFQDDIVDYKHSNDWIVWYRFTVGRQFNISVKMRSGEELKLMFKSFFGLGSNTFEQYAEIVKHIWDHYVVHRVDELLDQLSCGNAIHMLGVTVDQVGVHDHHQKITYPWENVATQEYYNYFACYHNQNATLNTRIDFDAFGAEILLCVIKKKRCQ
ncbi:hypothetical protein [Pseudochryseolinea flava]|uniref:Uncharacterized protein n=1 Tax=Pseudochryseolinea flava TaxID=2059302 RepID=A0A364XXQ2_9BACT|nr:hypothetical protein [Pseudochryseolinea flava]RAV99228.1 hypothetical protein DQQ10_20225 [Pseudochryseolinea flava]